MTTPRPTLILSIAGTFVAVALFAAVGCHRDIERSMEKANDLLYRKQYVESERLYRKVLRRIEEQSRPLDETDDEQRMEILDRLGKINALYLHDHPQAIAYYQMLVRTYPKSEQSFSARATIADIYHHKLGDLQAAIDAYQKLVADGPDRPEARWAQLQIVVAYFGLKNYEQARAEAETLINRWPQSDEARQARFQIASSYYVEGRYAEAIATYEALLQDKPDKSLASLVLFELGNCFQELGEPDRALAYYYACLSDHPNPTLVQHKIHRVRVRINRSKPTVVMDLSAFAGTPAVLESGMAVPASLLVEPEPAASQTLLPIPIASGSPKNPRRPESAVRTSTASHSVAPKETGAKFPVVAAPAAPAVPAPAPEAPVPQPSSPTDSPEPSTP